MILKDKIIKLPDCENLSMYAVSEDKILLYAKNTLIRPKILTLSKITRCQLIKGEYACDAVVRLSDDYLCLCLGSSMSVITDCCEHLL